LDAAVALGIEHGGWCPRGRLAEDGVIPRRYRLRQMRTVDYPARTEKNVLDSEGTLILYRGRLYGGTRLTYRLAQQHQRPCCLVDLERVADPEAVRRWLGAHAIRVLNVAGPRESSAPGIGQEAFQFVCSVLAAP
jgi:hypothetical protein